METKISYDKEKLIKLRDEILNRILELNQENEDDVIYGVPYIVDLIDRLLYDEIDAAIEVLDADISKERFPVKNEVKRLIQKLDSSYLDLEDKDEIIEELKDLYDELVHEEKYLNIIMKYYNDLQNLITLEYSNTLSRKASY